MTGPINNAYVAGYLDGEGTITISVNKSTAGYPIPGLRVAFANFDPEPHRRIMKKWGGSHSMQKTEVWALHINGKQAAKLLVDVQKWCIIKRDAVDAAILFQTCPFVSPDDDPHGYCKKINLALEVMYATRRGYKAKRGTKMIDTLREAIHHVNEYLIRTTGTGVRDTYLRREDIQDMQT